MLGGGGGGKLFSRMKLSSSSFVAFDDVKQDREGMKILWGRIRLMHHLVSAKNGIMTVKRLGLRLCACAISNEVPCHLPTPCHTIIILTMKQLLFRLLEMV